MRKRLSREERPRVNSEVVPGTQLFFLVSAQLGTTSARVLEVMEDLACKKKVKGLLFSYSGETSGHGLVLCDVPGAKFSLRYSECGSKFSALLPIGAELNPKRIEGVASNILAMVLRGEGWKDRSGTSHAHPYDKRRVRVARPWRKPIECLYGSMSCPM